MVSRSRPAPYAGLAARAGLTEATALELIEQWLADGSIKRFGVIVRHHELGYRANAMCVWDVPDSRVSQLGARLAARATGHALLPACARGPSWPYNLFCMIHGTLARGGRRARSRPSVAARTRCFSPCRPLLPAPVQAARRALLDPQGRWAMDAVDRRDHQRAAGRLSGLRRTLPARRRPAWASRKPS